VIGRRTLWELFHVLVGVVVACLLAWLCAWSYPLATLDFWIVAIVALLAFVVMSVPTIRRAMIADRAEKDGK